LRQRHEQQNAQQPREVALGYSVEKPCMHRGAILAQIRAGPFQADLAPSGGREPHAVGERGGHVTSDGCGRRG
jgi:hypothetical protein